ncbi:MAG TPA: YdeI/OmpD-associated family protein [Kofleriaceae bacterium]
MATKTYRTTLMRDGMMCAIPVPFDPEAVFGKVRAPVKVTLNGFTYRSTITRMGGETWIPLRKSNREAAGLDGTETLSVTLALDTEKRTVEPPPELAAALKKNAAARAAWSTLAFTHQREHAEAIATAKAPETKARRVAKAIEMLLAKAKR